MIIAETVMQLLTHAVLAVDEVEGEVVSEEEGAGSGIGRCHDVL